MIGTPRSLVAVTLMLALSSGGCRAGTNQEAATAHQVAADSVLAQFARTPLVAIGEHHRSAQVHAFLQDLLARPAFARSVDDIVVEFGNAHYQPVMDRYVRGDSVDPAALREAWRGTGQWVTWDSPLYEQFFAAVRRLNATLPDSERVRVVLGDPPVHWPDIATAAQYRAFAERDSFFAEVVEREVLSRGRRGLVIIGAMHLMKREASLPGAQPTRAGAGRILHERRPGQLFVVWTMPPDSALAVSLGLGASVPFLRLRGSAQERTSFGQLLPERNRVRQVVGGEARWVPIRDLPWATMGEVVDALLFVGTDTTSVDPDPAIYQEPAYQAELRRRAVILREVYGFDFLPDLEALIARR